MNKNLDSNLEALLDKYQNAKLKVFTLGNFELQLEGQKIQDNWGREKAIQLFQFFLLSRNRSALHKEQIINRLWEENGSDQDFKVALHGINKVLDPQKLKRGNSIYIQRQGQSYRLLMDAVWLDSDIMESYIELGNHSLNTNKEIAIVAFQSAVDLYKGDFLPNRIYEDWTTTERERIQMLALNAVMSLAELMLNEQPNECIRLTEKAIKIDLTWEEAYRTQMNAHMINGNRPQAIKTYQRCEAILDKEFGIEPLPVTKSLFEKIKAS